MTPIESAARALCKAHEIDPDCPRRDFQRDRFGNVIGGTPAWRMFESDIRTIFSAIREPSEDMIAKGNYADSKDGCTGNAEAIFPAMIEAMLEEG